jgi:hypothetical protein
MDGNKMTTNTEHEMNEATCLANGKETTHSVAPGAKERASSAAKHGIQGLKTHADVPWTLDPYNLPAGDESLGFWQQLLITMDEQLEKNGWDQPAALLAIRQSEPPTWLQEAASNGSLHKRNRGILKSGVLGIQTSTLFEMSGNIVEEIWGYDAPAWAGGVILVCEAWLVGPMAEGAGEDPHRHLRASEHPRRKEVRLLTLLTRGGQRHSLKHPRGQAVRLSSKGEEDQMGGLIPAVLARSLGLPALGATRSVGEYLGYITLSTSLKMARQFNEIPTGIDFDKAELQLLRQMSAKERRSVGSDMAVRIALEGTLQICKQVLKADVTFINAQSLVEPAELKKLRELAIKAGAVSWSHFVEVAGKYLPADAPDQSWAGEALFSQYVLGRYCSNQKTLIAELKELISPSAFASVLDLCESSGWLS